MDFQSALYRTGFLKSFPEGQSAAEFSSNPDQTHLWFSNDPEDSDWHAQVCLIRVRAQLCRNGPDLRTPGLEE